MFLLFPLLHGAFFLLFVFLLPVLGIFLLLLQSSSFPRPPHLTFILLLFLLFCLILFLPPSPPTCLPYSLAFENETITDSFYNRLHQCMEDDRQGIIIYLTVFSHQTHFRPQPYFFLFISSYSKSMSICNTKLITIHNL